MARNTASVPTKTTGSTYASAEFEVVRGFVDQPSQSLGTFNPSASINLDGSGEYSEHTATGDETWNFNNLVNGNVQWLKLTTDGSHTFAPGTNAEILSGSLGQLDSGTYKIGFCVIFNAVQIIVPNSEIQTKLETPTLSATAGDGQITITFSNEDANATGRELLRSTTNDLLTASAVTLYDGSSPYVDAEPANGTTYYYWGRNTANGFVSSDYGTDSATPQSGVTQLNQPTMNAPTRTNATRITVTCDDPNTSPQEENMLFRKSTSPDMSANLETYQAAAGTTSHEWEYLDWDVTYYFDVIAEGNGSSTVDSNPATAVNAKTYYAPFVDDYRLSVSDSANYISVADETYRPYSGGTDDPFTIEFDLEVSDNTTSSLLIAGLDEGNTEYKFLINMTSGNQISFFCRQDASNKIQVSTSGLSLNNNTKYHIVCTYDASAAYTGLNIKVNNVNASLVDQSVGSYTGLGSVITDYIFRVGAGTSGAGAKIGNVRYFPSKLSDANILLLYNSGSYPASLTTTGLIDECSLELRFEQNANANAGTDGAENGTITYVVS